ncbi:hypothetical protein MRX96_028511 [Rhipicephalus microplus]
MANGLLEGFSSGYAHDFGRKSQGLRPAARNRSPLSAHREGWQTKNSASLIRPPAHVPGQEDSRQPRVCCRNLCMRPLVKLPLGSRREWRKTSHRKAPSNRKADGCRHDFRNAHDPAEPVSVPRDSNTSQQQQGRWPPREDRK